MFFEEGGGGPLTDTIEGCNHYSTMNIPYFFLDTSNSNAFHVFFKEHIVVARYISINFVDY